MIGTEITKAEYLQACNEKVRLDALQDQQDADAERLRLERERLAREEAERLAIEQAERLAREEAERLAREEAIRVQQENAQWDAWYNNLPIACKGGFSVGGFTYKIDTSLRKVYKKSNGSLGGTVIGFTSGGINQELGL